MRHPGRHPPSRRDLLLGAAAAPFVRALPAFAAEGGSTNLVVVLANGGWDVTCTLDPKLGDPEIQGPEVDEDPLDPDDREAVRTFAGIPIVVNEVKRPSVTAYFERWAARTVVVNGIWTGAIAHDPCRWRMLTGRTSGQDADLTAIVGAAHGAALPLGSIDASGRGISGALAASVGRVGARGQLEMLLQPSRSLPAPSGPSPGFVPTGDEQALLTTFVADRAERQATAWGAAGTAPFAALAESSDRAERLRVDATALVQGLHIGYAPTFTSLAATAVDLLAGQQCAAILLDSGGIWDTHENNVLQHDYWDRLFADLTALVGGLSDAGILDRTLVAVVSEMTRTPKLNDAAGKDHWPHTSAMLIGGPTVGGRTCGATSELLESLPMDLATGVPDDAGALCRYDNFVAGILSGAGVDPEPWLPGSEPFVGAYS